MPNWDGIEDVSPKPLRVWLTKGSKETDHWKPLRKVDCWALNESEDNIVTIDGGRYTADKEKGIVTSNYHKKAPQLTLGSAIWFIRKDPNNTTPEKKESNLEPILSPSDTEKIETLYQLSIEASSSFGKGIDDIINSKDHETPLDDGSIIKVHKVGGNVLSIKKQPPGWLGGLAPKQDLQRGYGTYVVEGEDVEMMLGPVKHLYFVVHGVGESLWARDDVSMSSLVEDVGKVRMNVQNRQVESWRKLCEKHKKEGLPVPPMPDRVEFIPIEWWDRIHSSSNVLSKSLQATTLPTIPSLRTIANAAVFDVLMYLTPTFCEQVLDCVNTQITQQYNKFLQIHPNFVENGGKCSLIGHSLGSVICWDLLAVKKEAEQQQSQPSSPSAATTTTTTTTTTPQQRFGSHVGGGRESSGGVAIAAPPTAAGDGGNATVTVGYQAYADEENADIAQNGVWGPTLPQPMKETLPFTPENVVFLGSPLGMFLTLRGAHPVFDEFRKERIEQITKDFQEEGQGKEEPSTEIVMVSNNKAKGGVDIKPEQQLPEVPYASNFTLPVNGGVYNVFHPSDPVAYRIEPLLLPPDTDEKEFPPPVHLTVEGEGLRFHLKAQEIGGEIGKFWENGNKSFSQFLTKAVSVLAKPSDDEEDREGKPRSLGVDGFPVGPKVFPLGGQSQRVDFQLQRNVVDSEYLSAVTAHSTYFVNTDVQDFVMSLAAKASAPSPKASAKTTNQRGSLLLLSTDNTNQQQQQQPQVATGLTPAFG